MSAMTLVKNMPLQQKRAGKLLLGFFALMLAFTMISRSLDAGAIPTVTTVPVASGSLSRKVTVNGTVEAQGETAVAAPSGHRIVRLPVEVGDRVEEGDLLALLDLEDAEEELEKNRRSLEKLRLNAALDQLEAEKPASNAQEEAELTLERAVENLARAEEDLERVVAEGSLAIRWAERDLSDARKSRRELRDNDATDAELSDADRDINSYLRAVDQAQRDAEAKEVEAQRAIEDARRAVEDAELGIDKVERDLAAEGSQDAVDAQKRSLETQIANLDMADLAVEINRLETLIASEGRIVAPVSGVVTKISASLGSQTSSESLLLISDTSQGSLFRGTVEEEMGKHLERGDTGSIQASGMRDGVNATILNLKAPEEKGGDYTVTVSLDAYVEPGTSAVLTVEKRSKNYPQMVPLSALHSDGSSTTSGYVYVLRETTTAMGEETVVEKVSVQILEKSGQYAAVDGVFGPDDRMIATSSRALVDGDRVREESV